MVPARLGQETGFAEIPAWDGYSDSGERSQAIGNLEPVGRERRALVSGRTLEAISRESAIWVACFEQSHVLCGSARRPIEAFQLWAASVFRSVTSR
jgi:hypothetical protein